MRPSDRGIAVGSAVGAMGAAIVAVIATLCCAGPAVVAVLGAGGALAAAGLEPYRPYLLGASSLMLALGFWRAYRPVRSGAGATCSIRTGRVVRSILWAAALTTVVSALAPWIWT